MDEQTHKRNRRLPWRTKCIWWHHSYPSDQTNQDRQSEGDLPLLAIYIIGIDETQLQFATGHELEKRKTTWSFKKKNGILFHCFKNYTLETIAFWKQFPNWHQEATAPRLLFHYDLRMEKSKSWTLKSNLPYLKKL